MKRYTEVLVLAMGLIAIPFASLAQGGTEPAPPAPAMFERPHVGKFDEPSLERGGKIVAVELSRERKDPHEAARRLAGAVQVLAGEDAAARISKQLAYEALAPVVSGNEAGGWMRLPDTSLLVKYDAQFDEIRVLDEERDVQKAPGRDIGIGAARELAERYLMQFAEARVIDARLYERAAIQVGYKLVGEGPVDKPVQRGRIVEYRVTYRPRLHGFQLANAGLRLGISANGDLASLRVGGVAPVGEWRESEAGPSGETRRVRAGTRELQQRMMREAAKRGEPRIAWSRVMYVMRDADSRAVLEPMYVVSYTAVHKTDQGEVMSRRKTLAYSLTDPRAAPLDFDPPAAQHEDPKVRSK